MGINNLSDLNRYRSAPDLKPNQSKKLLGEFEKRLAKSDWITVGVMASKDVDAINALYSIIERYKFIKFQDFSNLRAEGNVFLKANQNNGIVYIRSENGLGEGILLTCQYDDQTLGAQTYGPFPLNFFAIN
tara:strand:+ start:3343 stop:3735 length:393 start_codon:yes stop_codon:yes gene_type:complete